MGVFVALALGYLLGAKTGGEDLDRLVRSLKALCATEEFADVVTAARSQVAVSLRQAASVLDSTGELPEIDGDLLARVRFLVGSEGAGEFRPRTGGHGPSDGR